MSHHHQHANTTPSVILATAGYDHTIRFWEASSGVCYRTIQYPESQVNCLEITRDKMFLASGGNPHVRVYDVINSNNNQPIASYDTHKGNVTAVGFQRDGKWLFSASEDGTVRIWDLRAPGCQRTHKNENNYSSASARASAAATVGGAKKAQTKNNGTVNTNTQGNNNKNTSSPLSFCSMVNTAVLHPNQGEIIYGDQEGHVRVWDLTADRRSADVTPEVEVAIRSVSVASDASVIAAGTKTGNIHLWDPMLATLAYERQESTRNPSSSSSSSTAHETNNTTTTTTTTTKEEEEEEIEERKEEEEEEEEEDDTTKLKITKKECHMSYILNCQISPDVKMLATASADHTVKLWHLNEQNLSLKLDKTLANHQRWAWDCVFSADSSYLVTASSDYTARLWDLTQGEVVKHYTAHLKAVVCVALNDSSLD